MNEFRKGEISILGATTVVEVGVDVPDATCMVVMAAERFGLATLHQLRGRVGRGNKQSFFFLVYQEQLSAKGKKRLVTMRNCNDGFLVADELLYDGENACLIWETFARRGIGYSCDGGSADSRGDGQEAFDLLPECVKEESTGIFTVDPDNLTWYMINAIKELSAKVKELESRQ